MVQLSRYALCWQLMKGTAVVSHRIIVISFPLSAVTPVYVAGMEASVQTVVIPDTDCSVELQT